MSFFTELNGGVPFMDGRTKSEAGLRSLIGGKWYIEDAAIINSANGRCAVLAITGMPDVYFFGGKVITDKIQQIKEAGKMEELKEQNLEFVQKENANGQPYFDIVFS